MASDKLQAWESFINKNINEDILVDDKLLRVVMVNQGKSSISEFFFFEYEEEIIRFLKEVILPSITLSSLITSKGVSIYLREHKEVLELIEMYTDYFNVKIGESYVNSYKKIELIEKDEMFKNKIEEIIKIIESEFDAYNEVYISLDYGDGADGYLKNLINEYKKEGNLEILERELLDKGLSVQKLEDVISNIFSNEKNIRNNILDKLPI